MLLEIIVMNQIENNHANPTLNSWLRAVSSELEQLRGTHVLGARPNQKQRNRAREKARREARQLFAEYERELFLGQLEIAA